MRINGTESHEIKQQQDMDAKILNTRINKIAKNVTALLNTVYEDGQAEEYSRQQGIRNDMILGRIMKSYSEAAIPNEADKFLEYLEEMKHFFKSFKIDVNADNKTVSDLKSIFENLRKKRGK